MNPLNRPREFNEGAVRTASTAAAMRAAARARPVNLKARLSSVLMLLTLAGTGLGLKVSARKSLSANVDVAWPLKSTRAADGGKVTSAGKPRVHVRLAAEF